MIGNLRIEIGLKNGRHFMIPAVVLGSKISYTKLNLIEGDNWIIECRCFFCFVFLIQSKEIAKIVVEATKT